MHKIAANISFTRKKKITLKIVLAKSDHVIRVYINTNNGKGLFYYSNEKQAEWPQ